MPTKTQQLQIRISRQQKSALKRLARAAGEDVSSYVLSRLLPDEPQRFASILESLRTTADYRYVLAELNDFLSACPPMAFAEAVAVADFGDLSPYLRNYVAAMVEYSAARLHLPPPLWVRDVIPLEAPQFATMLRGLRMHLLLSSPIAFKRRNIFVDSSVGARV